VTSTTASTILFYVYGAAALAGALGLVLARKLLHGVVALFATLVAIAGLYLILGMEFLAAMQLFVYGGAVTVLVMFALMLAGPRAEADDRTRSRLRWAAGIVAVAFAAAFVAVVSRTTWDIAPTQVVHDTASIATILFSRYVLPFEIAGLSLTIALIGAVVIARQDDVAGSAEPDAAEPDAPTSAAALADEEVGAE
jgi:NADH-quinone oxidoreductase subunit J